MINLTQQMAGLIKKTAPVGCRFLGGVKVVSARTKSMIAVSVDDIAIYL